MAKMARNNNETVSTIQEASKVKTKEGQARSRASNNPATPEARTIDEHGKKVRQEDPRNKEAARIKEGHGRSRTSNGKRNDSLRPDDSKANGPGRGKKLNAYHLPSRTKPSWHKNFINEKSIKDFQKIKPRRQKCAPGKASGAK